MIHKAYGKYVVVITVPSRYEQDGELSICLCVVVVSHEHLFPFRFTSYDELARCRVMRPGMTSKGPSGTRAAAVRARS